MLVEGSTGNYSGKQPGVMTVINECIYLTRNIVMGNSSLTVKF